MYDNPLTLSTIGRVLRRRWRILVALAAIGAMVGVIASLVVQPAYESSSKVLLQGPREEIEVLTEAELAMSFVVLDRAARALGGDASGAELTRSVMAEVSSGNVIEIRATATSAVDARRVAEQVTEEYITFSTEILTSAAETTAEVLRQRVATLDRRLETLNRRIGELQGQFTLLSPDNPDGADVRAELEQLRSSREEVFTELDNTDRLIGAAEAQARVSRDSLRVIEPAVMPSAASPPTALQLVAVGALLGVVLGAFVQVALRFNDRRLRRRADVAAAVGAPVLGTVEPPAEAVTWSAEGATRVRSLLSWLIAEAGPQPIQDQMLEHLRYRRVLAQVPAEPAGWPRLLVVVLESDSAACRAVAQLTMTAALDGRSVCLTTDVALIAKSVEASQVDNPQNLGSITVLPGPDLHQPRPAGPTTVLDALSVSAARPIIAPRTELVGAMLVISSGVATASELFGVAQACRDAGCPVSGVLLVITGTDEEEAAAPESMPPPRAEWLGRQPELQRLGNGDGHRPNRVNGAWTLPGDV